MNFCILSHSFVSFEFTMVTLKNFKIRYYVRVVYSTVWGNLTIGPCLWIHERKNIYIPCGTLLKSFIFAHKPSWVQQFTSPKYFCWVYIRASFQQFRFKGLQVTRDLNWNLPKQLFPLNHQSSDLNTHFNKSPKQSKYSEYLSGISFRADCLLTFTTLFVRKTRVLHALVIHHIR